MRHHAGQGMAVENRFPARSDNRHGEPVLRNPRRAARRAAGGGACARRGRLQTLEKGEQSGSLARLADDLPLFSAAVPPPLAPPSAVEEALAAVNPDEITPRDALDLLYRIRSML